MRDSAKTSTALRSNNRELGHSCAPTNLGKTFGIVAILTFLSKFVGLARDMVILQLFGAGIVTDAFNYANLFAGNTIVLFGGFSEPFHQSAVTILSPRKNSSDAGRLILQLLCITAAISVVATAVAWLMVPAAISWLSALPSQSGQLLLWTKMATFLHIMLPLILIAGIVGLFYGVANVYRNLAWTTVAPSVVSISIVTAALMDKDPSGLALAWGALYGGIALLVVQFALALPYMKIKGHNGSTVGVSAYLRMLWPTALSTFVGQSSVYVDSFFASLIRLGEHTGGAWTAIINANRLIQLPLGVLLTAMILPILPRFSEYVANERVDELKSEFRWSLRLLMFLSLPMAALLLALPTPILSLLFKRGHFGDADTVLFAQALIWLVPSIIFCIGRDLTTRVFYAHRDSVTPYRIAVVAIFAKAILDWLLIKPLGVGGISLSTSLTTLFSMTCLIGLLEKKIGHLGLQQLMKPLAIMVFGSALTGATAYFVQAVVASHFGATTMVPRLVALGAAGISGIVVYLAVCIGFKLDEPTAVLARLRKSERRRTD